MFGHNKSDDDQQTTGGPGDVQAPSMTDGMESQDLSNTGTPAPGPVASPAPTAPVMAGDPPTPLTQQLDEQAAGPVSTDDAAQDAAVQDDSLDTTPKPLTAEESDTPAPEVSAVSSPSDNTSGPVQPPVAPADTPTPLVDDESDSSSAADAASPLPTVDKDRLAAMKQQALDHLEPLADSLSQDPEEEFRTTMMRIQANDNHTLLEKALNAAKKIKDDSARAQAMLDIINEINYFSQDK